MRPPLTSQPGAPRPRLRWSELSNLAGALTIARLPVALAIPFAMPHPRLGLGLYIAGVLTDVIDGYIARKTGTASYTGAMIDGVMDKLLHISVALSLVHYDIIPTWWLWPWFARDYLLGVMVLALIRLYLKGKLRPGGANQWGKWTTVTLAIAMVLSMLGRVDLAFPFTILTGSLGVIACVGYLKYMLEDYRANR